LLVTRGTDEGKQFDLEAPVVPVGRDAVNPVRLHDTEVSRRHAEFRRSESGYRLVDLQSANGTFVNGQPINDTPLQSGDQLQIGQTLLVYTAGPRAGSASDLAERISLISKHDLELPSAIIRSIGEAEGSRILARPDQVQGQWLQTALANLAVLYEASQAVSHILDVDQLLDKILDLVFKSIEPDRGVIMLRDGSGGAFEPRAARWRAGADTQEKLDVSRTIIDHVLAAREGVLVSDATRDDRFSAGQSIVKFGIREVLCVPMKGRHETVGVLYLDTRSSARDLVARNDPAGRFKPDHLALAIAVAHQAALAVEETRYHQAMVQSERLAAVGQTIAALSHHIKNILQGLRSGGEILKMGIADMNEPLLQQGWKMVEKNQVRIYDLVMDMLSYSKDREPAVEAVDLNALVGEVLELIGGRAKQAGVRLERRLDAKLPTAEVDPEALHRAVLNLVGNALDAVEEQPNPQVGVTTSLEADGNWLRIVVLDNGAGIPADRLPDLFKPFFSTKGSKGTGLGLAVSRKILREHGGDILVQSQPGKGSRFTVRLPVKSMLGGESNGTVAEI
jgi:signal transduction histidine kinase